MRGGIIPGSDLIGALGNNLAVFYHNRPKGPAAVREDVLNRELNGAGHERIVHVFALSMRKSSGACRHQQLAPGKSVDIDFLAAAGLRREYKPRLRSS